MDGGRFRYENRTRRQPHHGTYSPQALCAYIIYYNCTVVVWRRGVPVRVRSRRVVQMGIRLCGWTERAVERVSRVCRCHKSAGLCRANDTGRHWHGEERTFGTPLDSILSVCRGGRGAVGRAPPCERVYVRSVCWWCVCARPGLLCLLYTYTIILYYYTYTYASVLRGIIYT